MSAIPTPLWKKLGVRSEDVLVLLDAPLGWAVPDLPDGVSLRREARGAEDQNTEGDPPAETAEGARSATAGADGLAPETIVAFVASLAELRERVPVLGSRIFPHGALWIAWPRRAGGHESDVRERDIRELALPLGLVDVKVAALDTDWSGLRLVWRRERRWTPEGTPG